jgi:hypothetical protein
LACCHGLNSQVALLIFLQFVQLTEVVVAPPVPSQTATSNRQPRASQARVQIVGHFLVLASKSRRNEGPYVIATLLVLETPNWRTAGLLFMQARTLAGFIDPRRIGRDNNEEPISRND